MRLCAFTLTGACVFLFLRLPAFGQASTETYSAAPSGHLFKAGEDKDPIAILELGAATSWNLSGGAATFAPNIAAEVTPIENWLELEPACHPTLPATLRNGTRTCSLRNRGPYRGRQSSCWAPVPNGRTPGKKGR